MEDMQADKAAHRAGVAVVRQKICREEDLRRERTNWPERDVRALKCEETRGNA